MKDEIDNCQGASCPSYDKNILPVYGPVYESNKCNIT